LESTVEITIKELRQVIGLADSEAVFAALNASEFPSVKELKDAYEEKQAEPAAKPRTPFEVGKAYLIRTVTMAWTGRVTAIYPEFLTMEDGAWIADTGRYHEAIAQGVFSEVEPAGNVIIGIGSIVDAIEWKHDLPMKAK
jgi:hypothetical protein